MSEKNDISTLPDIVITNNNLIKDNLIKLTDKIVKIKYLVKEDEEDEYDNFYNRINFYFSNIVTEIKLIYLENMKSLQEKENEYNFRITELEEKLQIYENEKDQGSEKYLKKIFSLETELNQLKDSNEKLMEKFRNILETNKKNEDEIVKLIMENIVLKIENENLQENFIQKSMTPLYFDCTNLYTNNNDNEVTILETNPNIKSRNARNISNEICQSHSNLTFDNLKKSGEKIFSTNNYTNLFSKDFTLIADKVKYNLNKYQKGVDSIKSFQKYTKLAKSTNSKRLLNNEKTVSNLLKTNSSFNTKLKGFDPNDVRMTSSPIDKPKSLSQNLQKKDTIKSSAHSSHNPVANKVSSQIKGMIEEKYKMFNKSIHGYSNIPNSIELEKYKNNIMDKINHIRNNNETWDIEKKGKDKLTNSKSFSKNKK